MTCEGAACGDLFEGVARSLTPREDREEFKDHILGEIFAYSVAGGGLCGLIIWIFCYYLRRRGRDDDGSTPMRRRRRAPADSPELSFSKGVQMADLT